MSNLSYDEQNFLNILKAVANDTSFVDEQELTSEQWSKIIQLSEYHNVFSLVFEKLSENSLFIQLPEYSSNLMRAMSMIAVQARKTDDFLNLYRAFVEVDIHPIVMKGLICRLLYGDYCDHRPSGDEDILIQKNEFEQATKILQQQRFKSEYDEALTIAQLEEVQEVTFHNNTGLSIELHINPFGRQHNWHRKVNDYFLDVFERYREVEVDGVLVRTMSHTDHLLFLILHTFKHFIGSGVGIRQVLDILLYTRQYGKECDWDYLNQTLNELKADGFFSDLIYLGNQYLGFNLQAPMAPNCPERLLQDILNSGIFGNATEVQQYVTAWTNAAIEKSQSGKRNCLKETWYLIFPARAHMVVEMPEVEKKPWLLPVCWVKRWIRILKRNKDHGNNVIVESRKLGQKKIELLKKYKIL